MNCRDEFRQAYPLCRSRKEGTEDVAGGGAGGKAGAATPVVATSCVLCGPSAVLCFSQDICIPWQ